MQRKGGSPVEGGAEESTVVTTRQSDLAAMRVALLGAMAEVGPRDLPRVCAELRAVGAELESLSPVVSDGQALVDDLRARRARRRTASQG